MKKEKKYSEGSLYSEENLEGLVNDIFFYLYNTKSYRAKDSYTYSDERLSDDVMIYTLNKRYTVREEDHTYKIKNTPIFVEENIKVEDYVEYYNKRTLTLVMDSILCEYLYYKDVEDSDIVSKKIDDIFLKHGFYVEFGSSSSIFAWTKNDYPY